MSGSDVGLHRAMEAMCDEKKLQNRLDEIVERKELHGVCVGVLIGDGHRISLTGGSSDAANGDIIPESSSHAPVTAGCLAKSLTATLMSEAAAAGRVRWNDCVADVLTCGPRERQQLAGITLRHLLDHSHGLGCIHHCGSALPCGRFH
jgi:CubicO group peptidase (beta-lactamase class C family)